MTRDEQIAAAYRAGITRGELAEAFGLTPRRIGQIAAKFGVRAAHTKRPVTLPASEFSHYTKARKTLGSQVARQAYAVDDARRKWVELAGLHVARAPDVYSYSASVSQEAA